GPGSAARPRPVLELYGSGGVRRHGDSVHAVGLWGRGAGSVAVWAAPGKQGVGITAGADDRIPAAVCRPVWHRAHIRQAVLALPGMAPRAYIADDDHLRGTRYRDPGCGPG